MCVCVYCCKLTPAAFHPALTVPLSSILSLSVRVGDVDGDFIPDLAIGASGDNSKFGAVYIAFLNRDGTYKSVVSV